MKWLALILALLSTPAFAVEPHEMLDDPVLEARAREISTGLRCPVCQNETIDESHAQLAAELRVVVRERLVAGDSDQEVVDYLVARYGEFVLLKPTARGANILLWLSAPLLLIVALGIGWTTVRPRPTAKSDTALTDAEKAELDKILGS